MSRRPASAGGQIRASASILFAFALVAVACSEGRSALDRALDEAGEPAEPATADSAPAGPDDPDEPIPDPEPDPTPLPVDPAVKIGTLDNGLTYYVRSNDSPGGNLELRLVVNAGSLQEPEPGLGIAHFLEHMLFNGTEQFPGNELDSVLRGFGAEIGPDFNAYTSYDETVYLLTVSTFDDNAVSTAFDVLSQWAGAATIDPQAVIDERGVVREEHRERVETGAGFVGASFDEIYTQDTAYSGYDPIGTAESIQATEAPELRAFYDAWYQPANMAVVAVGDLPRDELEALVIDRFSDLQPRGPAGSRTDPASAPSPDPVFHVVTHPDEATSYISLDIPTPAWDEGTVGGEELALMEAVIGEMVETRLIDAHTSGNLAQDTEPHLQPFWWTRELRFVGTNFQAPDLGRALTEFWSELRTIEESGFTDSDVERATGTLRAGYDFLLEGAGTTQDADYASWYVSHFLEGFDISTIDDTVRRTGVLLDRMTAGSLTGHFRWLMQQAGPIVIAVGPDESSVPTIDELAVALDAAEPGVSAATGELINELMARPEGVDAISTRTITEVGGAEWVFENGARVVFIESDIAEGAVDLWASSSGGWSLLEPGDGALAPLATTAVTFSGLGPHDRPTLDRFLSDSTAWIEPYIDQIDEGFFGASSTDDLVTLFQLLHLAITQPRVDDFAHTQAVNQGENTIARAATDPIFQTWLALDDALYGGDPWLVSVPTRTQLDGFTADAALAMYEARLGDVDDLVVAVVGDVEVQIIELMAERYIGTLPGGPADTFADVVPPPPAGIETRQIDLDDDVTAAGLVLYHQAPVDVSPAVEMTAEVLANIINSRLFLSVREDLGASYGGSAFITPLTRPDEIVESIIDISGDPDRLDLIRTTALDVVADLAMTGPTDDEFEQAVAVVGNDLGFTSNFDLLALLHREAAGEGDDVPWQHVMFEELDRLTPADVRDLAAALYPSDTRIEVIRTVG